MGILFSCAWNPLSFLFDSVLQNCIIPVWSKNFPASNSQVGFTGLKPQESLARLFLYRFDHTTPWAILLTFFGSKINIVIYFLLFPEQLEVLWLLQRSLFYICLIFTSVWCERFTIKLKQEGRKVSVGLGL